MIIGVGIDIVDIRRIDSLLQKFGNHFLKKIYTADEVRFCTSRKNIAGSLAKMYALKEATLKAISDVKGIHWHDIEIRHDLNGCPRIELTGNALLNLHRKIETYDIHATTSDEIKYAIAYVVIQSVPNG